MSDAPFLSVVYVTSRGLYPLTKEPDRHLGQYDLLAESLRLQAFRDFEVVVCDESNPLPRHELSLLGVAVRYVRPPWTPWRELGAFCAASARNAALYAARGEVVLGLDDCVSFGPDLLRQVAEHALRGEHLVPVCRGAYSTEHAPMGLQGKAGGLLAYPRQVALDCGGHEERFDGAAACEDVEFSERLVRHGVKLVMLPEASVYLHDHLPHNPVQPKCARAVEALLRGQQVANFPWTPAAVTCLTRECSYRHGKQCDLTKGFCTHPTPKPKCDTHQGIEVPHCQRCQVLGKEYARWLERQRRAVDIIRGHECQEHRPLVAA